MNTMTKTNKQSWDGYSPTKKRDVPEGLWTKCPGCDEMIFTRMIDENLKVCPQCGNHFRVGAAERIRQLCDPDTFEEWLDDCVAVDSLQFTDITSYKERLRNYKQKTNLNDAVVMGKGFIKGRGIVLAVMDFAFMGASMGSVVGEKITVAAETAAEQGMPLLVVCSSGGARMQEGILSLSQMAKTSAAIARLNEAGGLFISVLTDPTTGGVTASFAMLGDVIVAEPGALIGFAGPRVIANTLKVELPEGFQRAEFLLEHGFIDCVVARKNLRSEIARIIDYCGK